MTCKTKGNPKLCCRKIREPVKAGAPTLLQGAAPPELSSSVVPGKRDDTPPLTSVGLENVQSPLTSAVLERDRTSYTHTHTPHSLSKRAMD